MSASGLHWDVLEAYRRMVFNVLTYNRDDHAKNFSFVMDKDGVWSLSPAYDLVYSQGPAGWHTMDISGTQHPSIEDMMKLGLEHGIKTPKAKAIVEQVAESVSQWKTLARQHEVDAVVVDMIHKAMATVQQ